MPPLPPSFWNDEYRRLLALLAPKLADAAKRGAHGAGQQLGLGANYQMSDNDATQWAQTYTDRLLQQLGSTTENVVGAELEKYFSTPGATLGDLQAALTPKLAGNAARANAIAVTEVTRAYSAGQRAAYTRNGVKRWKWRASNDELQCPVCGAFHEKVTEIGQPFGVDKKGREITEPPAHPNCRCFVVPVVDVPGKVESSAQQAQAPIPTAQPLPVPSSLGAAIDPVYQRKIERYNELAAKSQEELATTVERLKTPNRLPKQTYHSDNWERLGVNNAQDYQRAFEAHLRNPKLRIFTGMKQGKRHWYLVDVENDYVSVYNESKDEHFSFKRQKTGGNAKYLSGAVNQLVELVPGPNGIEVVEKWKP